jgi:hypothetical protein
MSTPRVSIEWMMLNEGQNHFSYEDMGSLRLSFTLLFFQLIFGVLVIRSYMTSIRENERYFTPHPILLGSLAT